MKRTTLSTAVSLATAALASSLLAGPASAQSILEEVVVTAQKREQAITDVALTVTAISGDVARRTGIEDPRDVAFIATNVDIKNSALGDANPAITVRGIGMNNFNANNNPSVGVYADEVFLASPAMINLSMLDVGRIEVLKGPQGTLYGRNATGGAMNIISAKPTRETEGFVQLSAGEYGTTKLEGALSGALSDTLAGRISVLHDAQGESFHEFIRADGSKGEFPDSQTSGFRAQLAGEHTKLNWNLSLSYLDQDIGNNPFVAVGGFWNSPEEVFVTPCQGALSGCVNTLGLNITDRNGDPFDHDFQESRVGEMRVQSDVTSVNFTFDYDLEWAELKSITGWISQDREFGENIFSSPFEEFAVVHDEEMEQFSQELRLSGETENRRWLVGAFYWNDTFDSANLANSGDILGILAGANPAVWDVDQETTAYAVYGSVDFDLNEQWMLTVGARYSSEETDFAGGTQVTIVDSAAFDFFAGAELGIPNGLTIPLTFLEDSIDETSADFRVALEYRPSDELLAYASVTTGFKSGGFFGDITFDNSELEPFDSEEVTAWEVGTKAELADGKAQLNAAVFYYDYQDIQTLVPTAISVKLDNLEEADIFGAEVELLSSPADGLDIRLGLGYLDSEVSSAIPGYDGNSLPNAPELQATGTIRYEMPLSSSLRAAIQFDAKYTDDIFRESTNNPWLVVDSYTLLNGRVSVLSAEGDWEVAAWARNLTDEQYDQERFASDIIGMVVAGQGMPRVIGASVNYNF